MNGRVSAFLKIAFQLRDIAITTQQTLEKGLIHSLPIGTCVDGYDFLRLASFFGVTESFLDCLRLTFQ